MRLLADSQSANDFSISFDVIPSQVVEQSASLAYDFHEAAPGSMVFLVGFEMLGQVSDSFTQNCDLNFRGPRIGRMDPVLSDNGAFCILGQTHLVLIPV